MRRNQKSIERLLEKWYKRFNADGRHPVPPAGKDSHNNYVIANQYQQVRFNNPEDGELMAFYEGLGEAAEYGHFPAIDSLSKLVDRYSEQNRHKVNLPDKAGLKEYIKQHKAKNRHERMRTPCLLSLDGVMVNGEYLLEMMELLPGCKAAMVDSRRDPVVLWDMEHGDGLLMPVGW